MLQYFLNEQYYGKNKYLVECEGQFNIIKQKINEKPVGYKITKEMKIINNNIKELFGFKRVFIDLQTFGGYANAYTIPASHSPEEIAKQLKMKKSDRKKSKYGIQFDANAKKSLYVVLSKELMTLCDFTGGEMIAILLHEIGHNFFEDESLMSLVYRTLTLSLLATDIARYLGKQDIGSAIGTVIISTSIYKELQIEYGNRLYKNELLSDLVQGFNTVFGYGKEVLVIILSFVSIPLNLFFMPFKILSGLLSAIFMFHPIVKRGYSNEQFSDNFATIYGYGAEEISAFNKFAKGPMSSAQKIMNHVPVLAFFDDLGRTPYMVIGSLSDVHPDDISRMNNQIKYLERQSQCIKDEEIRKDILKDIKEAKKQYDKAKEDVVKANIKNGRVFSALYLNTLIKTDGDIRNKLYTKDISNYDQLR